MAWGLRLGSGVEDRLQRPAAQGPGDGGSVHAQLMPYNAQPFFWTKVTECHR